MLGAKKFGLNSCTRKTFVFLCVVVEFYNKQTILFVVAKGRVATDTYDIKPQKNL